MTVFRELFDAIDRTYTKKELQQGLKFYIFDFLRTKKGFCLKEGVEESVYKTIMRGTIAKKALIEVCCIPFSKKSIFQTFRDFLPPDIRTLMDELTWTEELSVEEIEGRFGFQITEEESSGRYSGYTKTTIKTRYQFFGIRRGGWNSPKRLFLPDGFQKRLAALYDKHNATELNPVEPGQAELVYQNSEKSILLELPRLKAFYAQGNIKLTKQGRPVLTSLTKMQKNLDLREFFEGTKDRVLRNIRTNALAGLLIQGGSFLHIKDSAPFIKALFKSYQKQAHWNLPTLLTTVKGTEHLSSWNLKPIERNIFNLLKELPINEWVSFQNIEDFVKYNRVETTPVSRTVAKDNLYFNKKSPVSYGNTYYIKSALFHKAIAQPLLKANFFLFAAYGLVEIAYNPPDTKSIVDTYFSAYDGLQYVRLTELGAYVSSEYRTYTPPKEAEARPLVLSEDSLMILSDEEDTSSDILLQNFTQKVGANRYQTDAAIFLKGMKFEDEIQEKIDLFKQTVTDEWPNNWKAFFEGLVKNINPFKDVSQEYVLLQIPPDNRQLIQLIAQDSLLKKWVLKGEQFHIFVSKANLTKFRNRLKEFGIFLS